MTSKRLFTLEEANAFIPQLLSLVPEIQKLSGSMDNDFPDIHNARDKEPSDKCWFVYPICMEVKCWQ